MSAWAIVLIVSVAGIVVILLRRLPAAVRAVREAPPPAPRSTPSVGPKQATAKKIVPTPSYPATAGPPASGRGGQSPAPIPPARPLVKPEVTTTPQPSAKESLSDLDLDTLMKRAEAAFDSRDYAAARELYEALLAKKTDPKWHTRLGVCNLELERFREARDAFRAALRAGDHVASRHANLAMAEFALGHRMTAIGHLRKAVALAPHTPRYQELLDSVEGDQ